MTSPSVSRRELLELAGGAAAAVAAVGCRPVPSAVEVRGREADVLTLADPLHYSSVRSLAGAISAGRVTSAEVVDNCLARIDAVNPALNAVVQLRADAARDEAREADLAVAAGEPLGPLHGVPMTIKDSLDTVDLVTTGGSQGRASFVPGRDATVVARARAAGAGLPASMASSTCCSVPMPAKRAWISFSGTRRSEVILIKCFSASFTPSTFEMQR